VTVDIQPCVKFMVCVQRCGELYTTHLPKSADNPERFDGNFEDTVAMISRLPGHWWLWLPDAEALGNAMPVCELSKIDIAKAITDGIAEYDTLADSAPWDDDDDGDDGLDD